MNTKLLKQVKNGNTSYFYNSWTWRMKRLSIIERDNNECRVCKSKGKVTIGTKDKPLTVHHIKELKNCPELMLEENNLVTVCFSCHNEIHNRFEGREGRGDRLGIPERW